MKANARRFRALIRPLRNEDGAALVYFGLSLTMLLACFAVAVDIGAVLNARSEAQRAADAGALAGAGLFMNASRTPDQSRALVLDTAVHFASLNTIGGAPPADVHVSVIGFPAEHRVRVEVRGEAMPLFARFIGRQRLQVTASAEAEVTGSAGATCVKPFALPDMWSAPGAANPNYNPMDPIWEEKFNPDVHSYKAWDGTLTDYSATGYGAPVRNNVTNWQGNRYMQDNGRRIVFKTGSHSPAESWMEAPVGALNGSDHMLLDIPNSAGFSDIVDRSGNAISCDGEPGGGGAALAKANVCQCNNGEVIIGSTMQKQPGDKASITKSLRILYDADPNVAWDPVDNRVEDPHGNPVTESPRIIKVILYNPTTASPHARGNVEVVNVGLVFVEGFSGPDNNVSFYGRFMMFATGTGAGDGTTTRTLQLVK